MTNHLLTAAEAAAYVNVSIRTLARWRAAGSGPVVVKLSARTVRYRVADLDAWIATSAR